MNKTIFSGIFCIKNFKKLLAIAILMITVLGLTSLTSSVYAEDSVTIDTSSVNSDAANTATTDVVSTQETQIMKVEEKVVETTDKTTTENTVVTTNTETETVTNPNTTPVLPIPSPVLSTDKSDYHPGQTATIFGKYFGSLQNIILKIFGSDDKNQNYVETTKTITIDNSGEFSTPYTLDGTYRPFYEMEASTLGGITLASGIFRDSAVGTYDQCANDTGTGYTSGSDLGCNWIKGNLQSSNSAYYEGDSTVQRVWMEGFEPATEHTVTFKYGTTKGGHHAYDYLTKWNASEGWLTDTDRCQDITNCTLALDNTGSMQNDPNITDTIEPSLDRYFTIRGGTIKSVSIPSIISGTYFGDSETAVTVTFTTDAENGKMCSTSGNGKNSITSCGVAIWFGAHIAESTKWNIFNGTTGAGSISGSPYHVALLSVDGADASNGGGRDNQMQANSIILPSTITIHKVTNPVETVTPFAFTTTGTSAYTGFSIAGGQFNTQTVVPGSYTVTETNPLPNYANTALTCTVTGTGSSATPNLANRSVAITVGSTGGAVVDCIYTNTLQQGDITVLKNVVNHGSTKNASNFAPYKVDSTIVTLGQATLFNSGNHTVTETIDSNYIQTFSGDCDVNGIVSLSAGQHKTCTITNTEKPSKVIVHKVVVNNGLTNDATHFAPYTVGTTPVVLDTETVMNSGTYTVAEKTDSNYTAVFSGECDVNGSITLTPGTTKTCTITNTEKPSKLIVNKVVTNDNGGTKVFSDFPLHVDVINTVVSGTENVFSSGNHSVSETNLPGYTSTISGNCDADGSVTLTPGETKTCTITNNDIAPKLHLRKVVTNNNGGSATVANFTLTANGTGSNDLSGTSPVDSDTTLKADTFALSETNLPGYTASAWSCVGGVQNGSNITLSIGQEATCTITNDDEQAYIIVNKTVTNDNGGTASANDFNLKVDDQVALNGVKVPVNPGVHTASETNLPGYEAGVWGTDCSTTGQVTVALGETKTCTITNNDIAPKITIVKDANPNDLQDFIFNMTGQTSFLLDDDAGVAEIGLNGDVNQPQSKTFTNLSSGTTYSVTETMPNQYWKLENVICLDNKTQTTFPAVTTANGINVNLPLAADITCTFNNYKDSPTRTQGFWQTHTAFTSGKFATYFPNGMTVGSGTHIITITNTPGAGASKLFGAYYSNISKTTTNTQRTPIDKARMQLLQQLVTAKLNCATFACSQSVKDMITNADVVYATGTEAQIIASVGQMDAYNNSGDTIIIGNAGKATPKDSQNFANKVFWNLP